MPGTIAITTSGSAYTQNFDTLSNVAGTTTNTLTLNGWWMDETGGGSRDNEQYAVNEGSSLTGDTYSYGAAGSTDRALGGLRSGTLIPNFGANFSNNTGGTITRLDISFRGEQWRLGFGGRTDQLNFQISFNATGITDNAATWTNITELNFISPFTVTAGATNGNAAQNSTSLATSLTGLSILSGQSFWIRWVDVDATNADDGLAIDDFSLTAFSAPPAADNISIAPTTITQNEGNSGTTPFAFTVTRSSTTANTSVEVTITGGTGFTAADIASVTVDGVPVSGFALGTAFTVALSGSATTANVVVNIAGDTDVEANESFTVTLANPTAGYSLLTGSATGNVTNDDVGLTAIYTIQGNGNASPLVGQVVTTRGVVTAVDTNGFYMQDATGDGDSATSDGIFVFTSSAPGAGVVVGNLVQVAGTVNEFAGSTAGAATMTQLTAPTVTLVTAGVGVPAPVLISTDGTGRAPPTQAISPNGIAFWESLEGMRVTLQTPLVVANTNSNGNFGETYVVVSNGVGATGLNDRFGMTISNGDFNPERIQIDDDSGIFAGYTPNHTQGDVLANVTGIVNYAFAEYEVIVTEAVTTTLDRTLARETTTLTGTADGLTYASFNVENLDPTDPASKFDRLADRVVTALRNPDVIGLQEIQDADGAGSGTNFSGAATAQLLIDAIAARGGPIYLYVEVAPTANNTTGGEPNGNIRNGYLFNTERVSYVEGSAAWIDTPTYSGTRRPLVADFLFNGERFTAINVHSTSRGGSDPLWGATQPPANAGDSARTNQANGVRSFIDAALLADPTRRFVVNGDFNGFGWETALQNLTAGNVMRNLYDLLPAEERYSYIFQGNYQALDHIVVSGSLYGASEFDVVHTNAGYTDGLSPTDHDQPLARITQARAGGAGVAVADSFTTTEAAFYRGTVLANDTGGGAGLAVTSVNGIAPGTVQTLASGALLTLLADGTFTYNPDGAFASLNNGSNGADSFTYTLAGGSAATVTVTISGISSAAPSAGNDTITGTPNADSFDLSAGGNDTVSGGASNDAFSFGAAFSALDRVDGGSGTNDQVGISGNYTGGNALVLNANTLTNVEVLALLPGAGNSYNITSNDGNVAAGQELVIFAGNLGAGQNFTFNGSAETNGSFRTYGGLGTDVITGGGQNDGFYFGPGRWQAGDSVIGGGGSNDQLALDGDYTITIGAEADVETLALLAGPSGTPNTFNITLADAWTTGQARTVFGRNVTTNLTINGAAESSANLTLFGGFGSDTLTGGSGDDQLWGLEGNDIIEGGSGTDTAHFRGAVSTYFVQVESGAAGIVDQDIVADGNDGGDGLNGVEFAQFKDDLYTITPPIILDLDGGGVTTLSAAESNARFDMDGDGIGDDTSWFGRGEGLLFLDRDGNGTVSNAGEFSFVNDVAGARSDLEGLQAWDSNGDGQLSKKDARFRDFKIWQDRNGNGVVDAREIMTLRQAGVRSLSLTGTAVSGTYALGDTAIVNTGSFTRTNGRRGDLIDAVLTGVSSKGEAGQRSTVQAPAASIDRSLLGGSFDDALASLSNGGGRDSLEQRVMPIAGALMPERDLGGTGALDAFTSVMGATSPATSVGSGSGGGSSLDAGDLALASATPLTVVEHGNTLFDSLDGRLALMTQDMAAFGAQTSVTETDQWRRQGNAQVDLFAA